MFIELDPVAKSEQSGFANDNGGSANSFAMLDATPIFVFLADLSYSSTHLEAASRSVLL